MTDAILIEAAQRIGKNVTVPDSFNFRSKWLIWKRRHHAVNQQVRHSEGGGGGDMNQAGVDIARKELPGVPSQLWVAKRSKAGLEPGISHFSIMI